jgi:hypothetical protein
MGKVTPQWTLGIAVVAGVLNLVAGFGWKALTPLEASAVIVLVNAVALAVVSIKTRPIAPQVWTYLVVSGAAVVTAWGGHVSQGLVSELSTLVLAILALLTHGQVSPVSATASFKNGGPVR